MRTPRGAVGRDMAGGPGRPGRPVRIDGLAFVGVLLAVYGLEAWPASRHAGGQGLAGHRAAPRAGSGDLRDGDAGRPGAGAGGGALARPHRTPAPSSFRSLSASCLRRPKRAAQLLGRAGGGSWTTTAQTPLVFEAMRRVDFRCGARVLAGGARVAAGRRLVATRAHHRGAGRAVIHLDVEPSGAVFSGQGHGHTPQMLNAARLPPGRTAIEGAVAAFQPLRLTCWKGAGEQMQRRHEPAPPPGRSRPARRMRPQEQWPA